jgi:hypothetical protein
VFEKDILVLVKYLVWCVFILVFALESVVVSGGSDVLCLVEDWRTLWEIKRFIIDDELAEDLHLWFERVSSELNQRNGNIVIDLS